MYKYIYIGKYYNTMCMCISGGMVVQVSREDQILLCGRPFSKTGS